MSAAPEPRADGSVEVARILEEWLAALEHGVHPDPREVEARHPHLAAELREAMAALELLHAGRAGPAGAGNGTTGTAGARADEPSGAQIGEYRVVREVARGGMGVVYEAVQSSIGRRVALKVLPFAATLEPRLAARFRREAEAAGRLQHPHIVPIYSVGQHAGVLYYAMQYIEGESIAEALRDLRAARDRQAADPAPPPRSPLSAHPTATTSAYFRMVARLGMEAAEALHHAHARGVVHRDVKPGNLLVDRSGSAWITDFGLAALQTDASVTRSGDLLGTVRYMAPEQARGDTADARSDVYSLGATLYEMVTLEPAVAGRDAGDVFPAVLAADPVAPRRHNPATPVDLESVVLKAMARDPGARYATARDLAEDLRRFLGDAPVQARRSGLAQAAGRWLRRHRGMVGAAVLALALAAVGLAVGLVRVAAERERTWDALQESQVARTETDAALVRARIDGLLNASELAVRTDPVLALILAREAVGLSRDASTMAALRSALAVAHEHVRIVGHGKGLVAATFLPAGAGVLTASLDFTARVWDLQGRLLHSVRCYPHWVSVAPDGSAFLAGGSTITPLTCYTLKGESATTFGTLRNPACSAAFSTDGKRVLAGMKDGAVEVWDVQGKHLSTYPAGGDPIDHLMVSPDGRRVLAASAGSPTATLLDLAPGARPLSLDCGSYYLRAVASSPSGAHLLTATGGGVMRLWSAQGAQVAELRTKGDGFLTASFDPDGRRVVAGTQSGLVWLWEPFAGVQTVLHGHEAPVSAAAFAPGGDRIVTAGADRTACLWDLHGRRLAVLRGHEDAITSATFSADGAQVLTASRDGTARIWDLRPSDPVRLAPSPATAAAFHPSGQRIVVAYPGDPYPDVVDPTGHILHSLVGHTGEVRCVAYSTDGRRVGTGSLDDTARIWDERGRGLGVLAGHASDVLEVGFAPTNDRLFTRENDQVVRLWDPEATPPRVLAEVRAASDAEFEPGGSRLLVARPSSQLALVRRDGSVEVLHHGARESLLSVAWSPAATWFVTWGELHAPWVRAWRPPATMFATLKGHSGAISCLAFEPSGERLVTGSLDRTARAWDHAGTCVQTLQHASGVRDVAFLPHSGDLLSVSADGDVHVWSRGGSHLDRLPQPGVSVKRVVVSPAGDRVLTLADDAAPLLWSTDASEVRRHADSRIVRGLTYAERVRFRDLLGPANEVLIRATEYVDRRIEELLVVADVLEATRADRDLPQEVREAAISLLAGRKDDPIGWNLRAWSIVRPWGLSRDVYALALPYARAAHRLRPDDPDVLNTMGIACLRLGQYGDAVEFLERSDRARAASGSGSELEDVGGLALAYQALGRTEQAQRALARFRALRQTPRYASHGMRQDWADEVEAAVGVSLPLPTVR